MGVIMDQKLEQKRALDWCRRYPALVAYCETMEHKVKNGKIEIVYRDGRAVKTQATENTRVDL